MSGIEQLPMPNTYIKLMVQATADPVQLLAGTGLTVADVTERDTPIAIWQQLRCARNSAAMMARPDWHLAWVARIAEHFHGPLTAAVLSAPTLGDGLDAFVRYLPARIPYLAWRPECVDGEYSCSARALIDLGDIETVLLEVPLLSIVEYLKTVRTGNIAGARVELSHPPLANVADYERLFRCAFRFEAERCALVIPDAWRSQAHAGHDAVLWETALRRCEQALFEDPDATAAGAIARALFDSFDRTWGRRTPPTLQDMAVHLHVSVRTLNRRLRAAGTTYQQLVDDVRRKRAQELLRAGRRRVGDIAAELGYLDPASFGRAFRRWYGTTPGRYRRDIRA